MSDAMSTSRTSARPRKCAFLPEQGNPKCQPLERHPWCDGGFDDGRCALGPHTVSSMTIDSSGEEPLANVKADRCLELLKCLLEFGPGEPGTVLSRSSMSPRAVSERTCHTERSSLAPPCPTAAHRVLTLHATRLAALYAPHAAHLNASGSDECLTRRPR